MKAAVFAEPGRIGLESRPVPDVGPLDALGQTFGNALRCLMAVVASGRADVGALVTHRFRLDQIEQAYELFGNQRDGVLKVAITP